MKKRMLEIVKRDNKTYVSINYSSLEILNSCKMKANFMFNHGYINEVSSAANFGTLIHKALEKYYLISPLERDQKLTDEIYSSFRKNCALGLIPDDGDKRSATNGIKILEKYFETYKQDEWQAVPDAIEKTFEFIIYDDNQFEIKLFGTIDAIMFNTITEEYAVFDHKTTSTLGTEFIKRWNPNHQITGYIYGANKLGYKCNKAIINGIQVAKTKSDLIRVETTRTEEDFFSLMKTIVQTMCDWEFCLEADHYPMAGGFHCSQWGGCSFLDVCSASSEQREFILKEKKNIIDLDNSLV